MVARADAPALMPYNGVPDQNFELGKDFRFRLPPDAFAHTRETAVVRVIAERADGGPLPAWIRFNPTSGEFAGKAPFGSPRELAVKVTARDNEGREASTIFRLKLVAGEKQVKVGRAGLSEQIRQSGLHGLDRDRLQKLDKLERKVQKRAA